MIEKKPLVEVIMGSDSDIPIMEETFKALDEFDVPFGTRILSAHRTPRETAAYVRSAAARGIQVVIAGAGHAAHLAGVIAAETILPVIGIPIPSSVLNGMDSLLSTVQMPPGVPVGTMAIGKSGARNAALFAVQILALQDPALAQKFRKMKQQMAKDIITRKSVVLNNHLIERKTKKGEQ